MRNSAATFTAEIHATQLTRTAWAVVAAGVGLRLVLQWFKVENLSTDPDTYVRLSKSLLAGDGFSMEGTTLPTAFRPPLFPMLLAVPQWLGLSTLASISVVQLVSSMLLFIASWKLAILTGLTPRFATLTICVAVCDPLLLQYSTLPMTEIPAAAFLTWAAVFVLQTWQQLATETFRVAIVSGILAGCCFGFGGLCRPILLVACATSSIVLFVSMMFKQSAFTSRPPRAGQRLLAACVPAVVAAGLLCPWVIRNAVCFQQFIPATTHGGYTLLLGNNPIFYSEVVNRTEPSRWDGASLDRWNQNIAQEMKAAGIPVTDEVGRDRWMSSRAKNNIANDPRSFRRACLLRLRRFCAVVPTADAGMGPGISAAIGLFYLLIGIGLLFHFLVNLKQWGHPSAIFGRAVKPLILWSLVAAFLAIHSVYWTNTRMRAPLMPVLIVMSVTGYAAVFARQRQPHAGVEVPLRPRKVTEDTR